MTLEQINNAYQALCAEFGHLTLVQRNTVSRIAEIESQISKLNEQAGKLREQQAKDATSPQGELKTEEESQS